MNDLIQKAQSGNEEAFSQLIKQNVGLVWSIVRRFTGRKCEVEDLFQIGVLGFIKAVKRFDLSRNYQLSTYAVTMIIGEIKRFLRDDGIIKISRGLKEIYIKVKETQEYHYHHYGEELSIEDLSKMLNLSKEDIVLALDANSFVDSLDRPIDEESGVESIDRIVPNGDDAYEKLMNKMMIENVLCVLNKEEKEVITYRYFRELTQNQIAKLIGTSQVQVSRIEKKALQKMRVYVS